MKKEINKLKLAQYYMSEAYKELRLARLVYEELDLQRFDIHDSIHELLNLNAMLIHECENIKNSQALPALKEADIIEMVDSGLYYNPNGEDHLDYGTSNTTVSK